MTISDWVSIILAFFGVMGLFELLHFLNRVYIVPRRELKGIRAGYAIVEKGVITQGRGGYSLFLERIKIQAYSVVHLLPLERPNFYSALKMTPLTFLSFPLRIIILTPFATWAQTSV
jgi:hypothetical protein